MEKKPRRRLRGKLATVMELPMDVLFEIFSHVSPGDLLQLSRTTKEFRRVLLSRSSAMVWKRARESVLDLPECPPDMMEPAYANLVFSTHCHLCLRPNVRNVDWIFRLRVCGSCYRDEFAERDAYDAMEDVVLAFIPMRASVRRGRRVVVVYRKRHYLQRQEMLRVLSHFDKERQEEILTGLQSKLAAWLEHSKRCDQWAKGVANLRSQEIAQLKKERYEAIVAKLEELGWESELQRGEVQKALSNLRVVKQTSKLTERVWSNIRPSITEFMEDMRSERLAHEHEQLKSLRKAVIIELFKDYYATGLANASQLVMPKAIDYLNFPRCKMLVEDSSDAELTPKAQADLASEIPTLVSAWREQLDQDLMTRLQPFLWETKHDEPHRTAGTDRNEALTHLHLATTAYRCTLCTDFKNLHLEYGVGPWQSSTETKILFYPEVLDHHCNTLTHNFVSKILVPWFGDLETQKELDPLETRNSDSHPRIHFDYLVYDKSYSYIVKTLVELVGLPPKRATAQDMDTLERYFCCVLCCEEVFTPISTIKSDFVVVPYCTWREMATHIAGFHGGKMPDIQLLPSNFFSQLQLNITEDLMDEDTEDLIDEDANPSISVWQCNHCWHDPAPALEIPETRFTREGVIQHLLFTHYIRKPEIDKDYFLSFDASDHYPPPVQEFESRKALVVHKRLLRRNSERRIDFDAMLALL